MYKINFKDELVKGSIILFVMIALFNFLNYVFQILMNKMLGPSEYGVLAFLMSIMYIFGIPSEAIQTIVSRYTSKFNAKKEYGKIKDLLIRSLKKFIGISIILFILFTIFSFIFISHFFNISIYLLAITGLLIVTSFILPISRGILQGRKKFFALGFNLITDAVLKIIFGVLLVFIGIKAYGGIISLVISTAGAFILSFVFIKEITKAKRVTGEFENIIKYNIPNLFAISCIVLMYSLDIILAKKFFSPEILGQYAFVSLIALVISFIKTNDNMNAPAVDITNEIIPPYALIPIKTSSTPKIILSTASVIKLNPRAKNFFLPCSIPLDIGSINEVTINNPVIAKR